MIQLDRALRKKLSKEERQSIYNKYNGHCAYCGKSIEICKMQVDHLIPMEFYEAYKTIGKNIDTIDNLYPSCRSCNNYKSSLTLEKFRNAIERYTDVLMRGNVTYRNAVRFGQVIENKHQVVFYFETVEYKKE